MNTALWVVSIVLALAFLAAGAMKVAQSREQLMSKMPWAEDYSPGQIKLIGAVEVLGAVGLILPGLTGIAPILVPLAAVGLGLVMLGAAVVHIRRGDGAGAAVAPIVFALLCAFVAWGRFGAYPL